MLAKYVINKKNSAFIYKRFLSEIFLKSVICFFRASTDEAYDFLYGEGKIM